jgi:hypothetical protein
MADVAFVKYSPLICIIRKSQKTQLNMHKNSSGQNREIVVLIFFISLITNILTPHSGSSQVIKGRILDEKNEPVPYATIFVSETKEGTISNAEGNYSLTLSQGNYHLTIRSLGYFQMDIEINLDSDTLLHDIFLLRQEYSIKEIKVFPGKEDPAYFIMRKAMANASYFREKIKHYEAELYIKSNFRFTNIPKLYQNKIEINGKKLKDTFKENETYIIESLNKITYDYPQNYKQEVISKKSSLTGFDEPPVMGLMTSSFYEDRPNQVISPLSPLALKHYNFRYEGFITVGNFDVFKIKVEPKRKSDELVSGFIYIVDRLWCIYNVDFKARIEFFEYNIKQQYENLGNNNWMPVSHIINGNLSILGLKGEFYYGATLKYSDVQENQKIQNPAFIEPEAEEVAKPVNKKEDELRKKVTQITEKEELTDNDVKTAARLNRKILKEQFKDSTIVQENFNNYSIEDTKDSLLTESFSWDTIRAIPLTLAEISSYQKMDSLLVLKNMEPDSLPKTEKPKKIFSKIIGGHIDFCKDSLIRLGYSGLISPENAGFNTVDGYRYKQTLRFSFQPDSGKTISFNPEIGYAFNRKAVFGSLESRFVNILLKKNQTDVGFGKVSRDFKYETGGIDPSLNSISSWFFAQNYMKLYETSYFTINTAQVIFKNLYLKGKIEYNHFSPLENSVSYRLSDKKEYSPNLPKGHFVNAPELAKQKSLVYAVGVNYTKRQQKPWFQTSDFLLVSDFYRILLSYKQGVKSLLSSESDFSLVEFKFEQQANISPTAAIDWQINAGYFLNSDKMFFSQYKHFKTSEIIVPFQPFTNTFQMLNDYEFSTNKKYFNAGAEFKTEYFILRYLSAINRNTWSESLHLNYLSTPALNNYIEAGYSINNLFFLGNAGIFTGFRKNKFEGFVFKISLSLQ